MLISLLIGTFSVCLIIYIMLTNIFKRKGETRWIPPFPFDLALTYFPVKALIFALMAFISGYMSNL